MTATTLAGSALVYLLGCVSGIVLTLGYQDAASADRAEALRGDPPRRLRQRGETRL